MANYAKKSEEWVEAKMRLMERKNHLWNMKYERALKDREIALSNQLSVDQKSQIDTHQHAESNISNDFEYHREPRCSDEKENVNNNAINPQLKTFMNSTQVSNLEQYVSELKPSKIIMSRGRGRKLTTTESMPSTNPISTTALFTSLNPFSNCSIATQVVSPIEKLAPLSDSNNNAFSRQNKFTCKIIGRGRGLKAPSPVTPGIITAVHLESKPGRNEIMNKTIRPLMDNLIDLKVIRATKVKPLFDEVFLQDYFNKILARSKPNNLILNNQQSKLTLCSDSNKINHLSSEHFVDKENLNVLASSSQTSSISDNLSEDSYSSILELEQYNQNINSYNDFSKHNSSPINFYSSQTFDKSPHYTFQNIDPIQRPVAKLPTFRHVDYEPNIEIYKQSTNIQHCSQNDILSLNSLAKSVIQSQIQHMAIRLVSRSPCESSSSEDEDSTNNSGSDSSSQTSKSCNSLEYYKYSNFNWAEQVEMAKKKKVPTATMS